MTAIMTDWTPERVNWDETNFEGPHPRRMSAAREKCGPHPLHGQAPRLTRMGLQPVARPRDQVGMGSWRIQVTMVEDMGCGSSEGECF
jgi:hypothetical protein